MKVATPVPEVVVEAGVIAEWPAPWLSVTVSPATGFEKASVSVTVMTDWEVPSAATVVGLATAVETDGDGGPATIGYDDEVATTVSADVAAVRVTAPVAVGFVTPLTVTVTAAEPPMLEADSAMVTPEPLDVTPETVEPVTV
jgi:hypothetical protein